MKRRAPGLWAVVALSFAFLQPGESNAAPRGFGTILGSPASVAAVPQTRRRSTAACTSCAKRRTRATTTRRTRSRRSVACHPKSYVNPRIARNYRNAMSQMRRAGIRPVVTSAWRSSAQQRSLHKCSLSGRCRRRRGVYGAMPAGQSLHEAGLAVDLAGVAARSGKRRYLTARGRRMVRIMQRNGFNWRYGLADPAHFEVAPTKVGYRSRNQAIKRAQSTCQVRLASSSRRRVARPQRASARTRRASSSPAASRGNFATVVVWPSGTNGQTTTP
jgi:hypothetical protein